MIVINIFQIVEFEGNQEIDSKLQRRALVDQSTFEHLQGGAGGRMGYTLIGLFGLHWHYVLHYGNLSEHQTQSEPNPFPGAPAPPCLIRQFLAWQQPT